MPSALEFGIHGPFTGPAGVHFSDSGRSFISVAALVAKRMGRHVQFRRKPPRVILRRVNFRPLTLYMSLGVNGFRGPQDRSGRMKCMVRLMAVLMSSETDVPEVVRLMCLSFVVGPS